MQVFVFQAVLDAAGQYHAGPMFTTDGSPSLDIAGEDALDVVLRDQADARIAVARVPLVPACTPRRTSHEHPPRLAVAQLACPSVPQRLVVQYRGEVIQDVKAGDRPRVEVGWPPLDAYATATQVTWMCPESDVIGVLAFSADGGQRWEPVSLPAPPGTILVDLARLPGGADCRLRLTVLRGITRTDVDSGQFALSERGTTAYILSPGSGERLTTDRHVELVGQAYDLQRRREASNALSWSSSLDGVLGKGRRVLVRLSRGRHTITLAVDGKGTANVEVVVD